MQRCGVVPGLAPKRRKKVVFPARMRYLRGCKCLQMRQLLRRRRMLLMRLLIITVVVFIVDVYIAVDGIVLVIALQCHHRG